MNVKETHIELQPDASAWRVTTIREPVQIAEQMAQSLSANVSRSISSVFQIDGNNVTLVKTARELYSVMWLKYLRITCPWVMKEGHLVPDFGASPSEHPLMSMDWPVPGYISLVFVSRFVSSNCTHHEKANWLFVIDANSAITMYLLPVANLFDDGTICMGEFDGVDSKTNCCQGALQPAYNQFRSSKWNSDLFDSDKRAKSQRIFRFRPDGDKFNAIIPDKPTLLASCTRVESAITAIVRSAI